jgi:hypothetical protein
MAIPDLVAFYNEWLGDPCRLIQRRATTIPAIPVLERMEMDVRLT